MKGKWKYEPVFDYHLKKWIITLEVDTAPMIYDSTKDDFLEISLEKYRDARSDRANRYFHKLCREMAKVQNLSLTEVKNQMICDYGCEDEDMPDIQLQSMVDWRKVEKIHLQPTTEYSVNDDGVLYYRYRVMRGSHTYNTKEMSDLIHGTVEEAKQLGVETMTPDEIERMVAVWKAY